MQKINFKNVANSIETGNCADFINYRAYVFKKSNKLKFNLVHIFLFAFVEHENYESYRNIEKCWNL